ncbi:hypothetical protein AJ79_03039 [Helicocarpus griseus UAMH5409]|uniref:Phytocyanin domain-containing protein n=1 Tax=Helicocarpus griseus UAMH5409 TaxID=1447875 RepID=A0A2B7Y116_9EURO|nr:hypothetical protein AJ79_03039 [Helicocarpus griseus UAMH5409]
MSKPSFTGDLTPERTLTSTITVESTSSSEPTSTATSTTIREPVFHTVLVAPKQSPHAYVPSSIKAEVGDTIVFEFYPTNHSVAQADYDAPCVPAANPFWSKHFLISSYEQPERWTLRVNHTDPTFFYCTANGSCNVNGMVGAINPNETMTVEHQRQKAIGYPIQVEPGQPIPPEGAGTIGRPESTATSTPSPTPHHSLSSGAIAGIVVGCVVGIGILGALFFLLGRNAIYRKWLQSEDGHNDRTRKWALSGGGFGGWSTAAKSEAGAPPPSEMDRTIVESQPGHMSYMGPDQSPHARHLSGGFGQGSPPPQWGWDNAGASGMVSPMGTKPWEFQKYAPQELSAGGGGSLVELDGGNNHSPPPVSPNMR